jgi:hypothetical protein
VSEINMRHTPLERHVAESVASARDTIVVPPIDPDRERALLAAFDAFHARRRRHAWRGVWTAVAASAAMAAVLSWPEPRRLATAPAPVTAPSAIASAAPPDDSGGFVTWPGAEALPPFESGTLVRVELPASSLQALGISRTSSSDAVIPAEVVIGQDGLARAVRFLQH